MNPVYIYRPLKPHDASSDPLYCPLTNTVSVVFPCCEEATVHFSPNRWYGPATRQTRIYTISTDQEFDAPPYVALNAFTVCAIASTAYDLRDTDFASAAD